MKNRLIKTYEKYNIGTLDDFLSCISATIEDSFLTNGAVPNKDYSHLDIMKLAMQYITTERNSQIHDLMFTCGYPTAQG